MRLKVIKGHGTDKPPMPAERRLVRVGEPREEPKSLRLATPGGKPRILDRLRHRQIYRGFKIEVWETKESCGTAKPVFYTVRYNLSAQKPQPARGRPFYTVDRALEFVRRKVDRRRIFLDAAPKEKKQRREIKKYQPPQPRDPERLETLLAAASAMDGLDASCPVCEQVISRNGYALHTHLTPHVRKGLITPEQKKEIHSRLMIRRRKVVL